MTRGTTQISPPHNLLLSSSLMKKPSSTARLPELYGVALTPYDAEERYVNETLGDGLDQDHSCRHLARITGDDERGGIGE